MNERFVIGDVFQVERDPDPEGCRRTEKIIELHRTPSITDNPT
jgi:hypothetical protein